MARHIIVAVCTSLLMLLGGGSALACDTGSWLMVSGWTEPGDPVRLTGGGLDEGAVRLVWDRPSGREVGRGHVGEDGRLATEVRIPLGAAGRHKIIALAADGGTSAVEQHAWTDVMVGNPVAQAPAVPSRDAPARSDRTTPLAAALAAVAGAGLLLALRRRRPRVEVPADADLDAELRMLVEQLPQADKREVGAHSSH